MYKFPKYALLGGNPSKSIQVKVSEQVYLLGASSERNKDDCCGPAHCIHPAGRYSITHILYPSTQLGKGKPNEPYCSCSSEAGAKSRCIMAFAQKQKMFFHLMIMIETEIVV